MKNFSHIKIIILFIVTSIYLLIACNSTKVSIVKFESFKDIDTVNYSTYWTAMRCGLPELFNNYNVQGDYIDFANAIKSIKSNNFGEAENIFKKLLIESKNDTIISHSKSLLSDIFLYQSKWLDYYNLLKNQSESDTSEINRLLYPVFKDYQTVFSFNKEIDTIPFDIKHGLIFIPVTINGKEYELLFDTGFQISVLSDELADQTEIKVLSNHKASLVGSTGNSSDSYSGIIQDMSLGNFSINNKPCLITDNSNLKSHFLFFTVFSFDGAIGWDIIKNLDIEINYDNETMVIRKPVSKRNIASNLFWLSHPIVKLKSTNGVDLLFFLDLGAQNSSFYQILINKLQLDNLIKDSQTIYGVGGSQKREINIIPNISFVLNNNQLNYENLKQGFDSDEDFLKLDGVLGNDFPEDNILRIDGFNGTIELIKKY